MTLEKILLLEDRPVDAMMVRTAIEEAGYCVTSTSDEASYVAALKEGGYSAVVADNSIPGSSAELAVELAHQWLPGVPVLCVSGAVNERDGELILGHGALDYISKSQLWRLPHALKRATIGVMPANRSTIEVVQANLTAGADIDSLLVLIGELEARLAERTNRLETANEELRAFSYSVAHDLKSPLFGIHQISQLLLSQDNLEVSECRTILSTISDDAVRMAEMTAALLKLYTMTLNEPVSQEVDFSAETAKIVKTLSLQTPHRKVDVSIEPDLHTHADPALIDSLLENLIGNAWKYSSKVEQPKIQIGKMSEQEPHHQTFFVRDNGAGFDMKLANKLFKPFQRLHSPSEFTGLGIGLATVNKIVKQYGGKIWAESEKGEGATFFFTLPN
jgi:hypothetical protein